MKSFLNGAGRRSCTGHVSSRAFANALIDPTVTHCVAPTRSERVTADAASSAGSSSQGLVGTRGRVSGRKRRGHSSGKERWKGPSGWLVCSASRCSLTFPDWGGFSGSFQLHYKATRLLFTNETGLAFWGPREAPEGELCASKLLPHEALARHCQSWWQAGGD